MASVCRRVLVGAGCLTVVVAVLSTGAGAQGTVTTAAGTGVAGAGGDGGPAGHARLAGPTGIAVDGAGDVAVADTGDCRVRFIAARDGRHFGVSMAAQHIYTVAGSGCGHRHPASSTSLVDPTGVAFDKAGDLLIAERAGNRILELPAVSGRGYGVSVSAGRLTTVAGTGAAGFGAAASAVTGAGGSVARTFTLNGPQGIAVDGAGDLYIADSGGCQVDELPAGTVGGRQAGRIYTVAGTGICGFGGDGGAAGQAELWAPSAVAVDGSGDLLIADEGNSAVREVPAAAGSFYGVAIGAGDIGTVAGQDSYSAYLADGLPATGATADVNYPSGLAVDGGGDLFIADSYDRALREVPADSGTLFGRTVAADDMYTLAGLVTTGGGSVPLGDGSRWIRTRVTYPAGVAVGPGGSVYFSDEGADTVRRIAAS